MFEPFSQPFLVLIWFERQTVRSGWLVKTDRRERGRQVICPHHNRLETMKVGQRVEVAECFERHNKVHNSVGPGVADALDVNIRNA